MLGSYFFWRALACHVIELYNWRFSTLSFLVIGGLSTNCMRRCSYFDNRAHFPHSWRYIDCCEKMIQVMR